MTRVVANMFRNVCLGGTFDGIHAGHKLLFGEATRLCSERLIVGVTDTKLIKNKVLWELIAPVDERISKVKDYLEKEVDKNLQYHIVPISDIYGPTIVEKDLDCIIVSEETIKGADKINEARIAKGWHELKIHVINLLKDDNLTEEQIKERLKEKKVSSSTMRVSRLGSIIRPPALNENIPQRPYLIGLTGGIASGKTSIGKYLETLGFGYINYDQLGHKTYAQENLPAYKRIVEYFGTSIVSEETKEIDRRKLGGIVFSDKSKMEVLEKIVWPEVHRLVDDMIEQMKEKHEVIVLESAVLIEAGQDKRVHQLWTSIIPPEEAIKRLIETRGLSIEEAERRVGAQMDNVTRVEKSNAVFCSLWESEFTQQQVRKCVKELRERYL